MAEQKTGAQADATAQPENAETMISKEDLTSLISIVEKVLSKLKTKNNTTDNEPIPFTQIEVEEIINIIGVAQYDEASRESRDDAPGQDPLTATGAAPVTATGGNENPAEGEVAGPPAEQVDQNAQNELPIRDEAATAEVEEDGTSAARKTDTAGDEAGDRPPAETDPTAAENAGTKEGGKKKKLKLKKRKKSNSRSRKNKKGTKKKY